MASKKAVLFNLWGVVVSPRPAETFLKFEETHKLPSGFLEKLVTNEDSAMQRAERGKLSLSQMIPELDAECVSAASDQKVSLAAGFSVKSLLEELRDSTTVNKHILQTVATLRRQGLLTGVLANQWVDDSGCGDSSGRLLSLLGVHFDVVLQSCRTGLRVPEADLFISALKQLGVPPKQALWLADDEKGVGAAEALGMTAVLVKDLPEALKQVETFTGVQAVTGESYPASCNPEEVSHGYVTVKIKGFYCHIGSNVEFLAAAMLQRPWTLLITTVLEMNPQHRWEPIGVGVSGDPIEEKGVTETCPYITPLQGVTETCPYITPLQGVAETEMEKDLARTFKIFFRGSGDEDNVPTINTSGVCARGGLFVGLPDEIPRSSILSETALQFYITQFKDKGFRGPLNWYRNVVSNWKWLCSRPRAKLLMPALMVTAGKDPVLLPVFSRGMENMIPNLTRGHIEECGHWTQMERPSELNTILISWLKDTHSNMGVAVTPKL
ncbi:bifunctional epoxide hydrolase 2-like [Oncorhynchus masou masou]|uniref:bifunctional epoxide hydrolase 2-like n=1 Tax=Oncorhynchus masou masou TaxID=90313 RepID=UPI0031834AA8